MIVSRAYNRFSKVPFGLIRKESETERLADEISYYYRVGLDKNKAIFFPRVMGNHVSKIGKPHWLLLEEYGYHNLGEYLIGKVGPIDWSSVYQSLTPILSQFETFSQPLLNGGGTLPTVEYAKSMYITKTWNEYQNLVNARPDLAELFKSHTITVSDKKLINFETLWASELKDYIYKTMLDYNSVMIHGDFCFSNILFSPIGNIFKFIDPRGSFGVKGIFGDQRYDIAKMYHSVDGGYEFIINDEFHLEKINDTSYAYSLFTSAYKPAALREFEKVFFSNAFYKKQIKILEGCIFIGMCARHYDSEKRQIAMYLTGVKLLNEALEL
jgi:hypothetical protein